MSEPQRRRLDERVAPGWANLSSNLLRGGGLLVGALLAWLGFLTGGFFLLLTGALAAISIIGGWLLGGLILRESWRERPNARLLSFALVVAFPVALIVTAQIAGPLLTPAPQTTACLTGTLARGQERIEQLAVDPRIETMQFRMRVDQVSGGALRYFVVDPTSASAWSGRAVTPGDYQSEVIEASGGQWVVNLIGEAEQAEYRLEWVGSQDAGNPPPAGDCLARGS